MCVCVCVCVCVCARVCVFHQTPPQPHSARTPKSRGCSSSQRSGIMQHRHRESSPCDYDAGFLSHDAPHTHQTHTRPTRPTRHTPDPDPPDTHTHTHTTRQGRSSQTHEHFWLADVLVQLFSRLNLQPINIDQTRLFLSFFYFSFAAGRTPDLGLSQLRNAAGPFPFGVCETATTQKLNRRTKVNVSSCPLSTKKNKTFPLSQVTNRSLPDITLLIELSPEERLCARARSATVAAAAASRFCRSSRSSHNPASSAGLVSLPINFFSSHHTRILPLVCRP